MSASSPFVSCVVYLQPEQSLGHGIVCYIANNGAVVLIAYFWTSLTMQNRACRVKLNLYWYLPSFTSCRCPTLFSWRFYQQLTSTRCDAHLTFQDLTVSGSNIKLSLDVLERLQHVQRQDESFGGPFFNFFFKEGKVKGQSWPVYLEGSRGSGNRMETKGGSIATLSVMTSYLASIKEIEINSTCSQHTQRTTRSVERKHIVMLSI